MILPSSAIQGFALTSLLVSALVAAFLPLRSLLRRLVGSQWVCVLWLAILARLLLPWPVETRWGLFYQARNQTAPSAAMDEPVKIKVSFSKDETPAKKDAGGGVSAAALPAIAAPVKNPQVTRDFDWWGMGWLAGVALGMASLAWRWWRTRRLGSRTREATDARLLRAFDSIPAELRRGTQLRMTDAVHVPTLAGVFRPQIWMPQSWPAQFTDGELRNVLLHELGHARRGDLIAQWLFAIAQCVHWFNPLVWIAGRAARFDREMACDAWVLARNDDGYSEYGAALIKTISLLRGPAHPVAATVAMATSRRNLYARMSGIGAFRPLPAWRGWAMIAIMFAALAAATTSRTPAQETKNPSPSPSPAPTAATAEGSKRMVKVRPTFVLITEDEWRKLCAENADYKEFAATFPSLDQKAPPIPDLLKDSGKFVNGAWEVPGGDLKMLRLLSSKTEEKMIAAIRDAKGVNIMQQPAVITRSGQRAEVEIDEEMRYPTAFKADGKATDGVTPTDFITRNVGTNLEVKPEIGENAAIDLQLTPTMCGFLGWQQENYGVSTFVRKPDYKLPVAKIVFSTSTVSSHVNIQPGQVVLFGGVRIDNAEAGTGEGDPKTKTDGLPDTDGGSWDKWENGNAATARHVLLVLVEAEEVQWPPVSSSPAAQPSSTPAAQQPSPPPAPEAANNAAPQVGIESKFVEITEEEWKKLCDTNTAFKNFNTNLPGLAQPKTDYADLKDKLVSGEKGSWEVPEGSVALLGVLSGDDFHNVIKTLNQRPGVDLLSAPSVTTKTGQRARIEISVEFRYGSEYQKDMDPVTIKNDAGGTETLQPPVYTPTEFATRDVGTILDAQPVLNKDGTIGLDLTPTMTGFIGWITGKDGAKSLDWTFQRATGGRTPNQPVFSTSTGKTSIVVQSGQTALLGAVRLECQKDNQLTDLAEMASGTDSKFPIPNRDANAAPATVRRVLLVFVTATSANAPQSTPATAAKQPQPVPAADANLPYGTAVEGKPGYVTSPYSPDAGMVDVRGYEKGAKVRDPYTMKYFLVP